MNFKYCCLTICIFSLIFVSIGFLVCVLGAEASMARKDVKHLIHSAKASFTRLTADTDQIGTIGTDEGVHGVWNVLKDGSACTSTDFSENGKDKNCTITGDTEEIWMSRNSLKINYIHKEQAALGRTGTSYPAKGIDMTVVYWGAVSAKDGYTIFLPSPVSSSLWVGGYSNDAKYDPDYSGLEGNDLNNDYMKKNYNCSDLPEFASLNWLKAHCGNASYDGVKAAIDEIQTVNDIKTNNGDDDKDGFRVGKNNTDPKYAVVVKNKEGSSNYKYYIEKVLEIGNKEHIVDMMNIRTHNINEYTLHVGNFEFSNCSVAYTIKNDTYGSHCRYIYRGGIMKELLDVYENNTYIHDYTVYYVELDDYSSILSGIYPTQTFREYYSREYEKKEGCLALPNKDFIEFSWFSQNCNKMKIGEVCVPPSKDDKSISGFEQDNNNNNKLIGRFALRRSTSPLAHQYKYNKISIFYYDKNEDGKQLYSIGLANTQLNYTITKGFNYECYGNQEFISVPPTHGVIGALPYNNSEDLEIVYLTNEANVYNRFDQENKIYAKIFKKVVSAKYESTYTQYNYMISGTNTEPDMNEDYSGYDCSSDANVNFFKKYGIENECRCESEFISFRWIKEHCKNSDTIKDAVRKMKSLHTDNTIIITKNIANETVYFADEVVNNIPVIRKDYVMTRTTKLEASQKMMIDTHPINDTKVVNITVGGKQGYISDLGLFVVAVANGTTSRVKYDVFTRNYDSYSYYEIGKLNEEESGVFITNSLKEELKECSEIPPIYEDVLPYKWIRENCQAKKGLMIEISDAELNAIPKKLAIRSYDAVVAHKYGENELNETHIDYKLVLKSEMKEALRYYEESDYSPTPLLENEGGSSSWNDNVNSGSIITLHITSNYSVFTYLNKREATTVKIVIPSEKINQTVTCGENLNGYCNKFIWFRTRNDTNGTSNHLVNMIYDYSGYEGEANRIYFKENYKNCPSLPEFASFRWLEVNCKESIEKMVDPFVSRFVGEMSSIYYSKSIARPHNGTVYLNCKEENKGEISECETHPMIVDGLLDVTKVMLIDSSVIPEGNGCKLEEKNLKNEAGDRYDMTSYLSDYMVGKKRVLYNLDGSIKRESTLFCMTEKRNYKDNSDVNNNNYYTEYMPGSPNYVESKILVNDYVREVLSRSGCSANTEYIRYEWIYLNCSGAINDLVEKCNEKNTVLVGQKGTGFIALPIEQVEIKKEYENSGHQTFTTKNYVFVDSDKVYTIISNNEIFKELGYTAGKYMPIQQGQGAIGKWMTEVDLESLSVTDDALVYEYSLLRRPLTVKVVKYVESVKRGYNSTVYSTKSGVDDDYSGYENNNANGNYIENKCELTTTLPEFISFNWLKHNCANHTKELIDQMSSRYMNSEKVEIARIVDSIDKANIIVNNVPDVDKLLHIQYYALVKRNQMINTVELPDESGVIVILSTTSSSSSATTVTTNSRVYYGGDKIVYVNENTGYKCYKQYALTRSKSGVRTTLTRGSSQGGSCSSDAVQQSITVALRYEGGINAYNVDSNDKITQTNDVYLVKSLVDVDNEADKYIEQLSENGGSSNKNNNNNDKENINRDDSGNSVMVNRLVVIALSIMIVFTLI